MLQDPIHDERKDGGKYEGDRLNDVGFEGEKHGYGRYEHTDGSWYEGEFQHDLMHGEGKMRWADGSW